MSAAVRVTIDAARVSPSRAIGRAARSAPLLILTGRMFGELADELGGQEAAMHHLLRISERTNRPIGCNFKTPEGSRTAFVAPRSWSQERLRGWVGGKHEDIAAAFGPGVPLPPEDAS